MRTMKALIKAVIPSPILSRIWLRLRNAQYKLDTQTIRSLILTVEERKQTDKLYLNAICTPDFLTFDWLLENIANFKNVPSYFTIFPVNDMPSICVPSNGASAMAQALVAVAVYADLDLIYERGKDQIPAEHHSEILRHIAANRIAVLGFSANSQKIVFRVEKWDLDENVLIAPRANNITRKIYLGTDSAINFLAKPGQNLKKLYDTPLAEDCVFDVDVVYTWVNSNDTDWQAMLVKHTPKPEESEKDNSRIIDKDRFENRDELKYSLRSLFKFAPWVRHVYIVSNCAPPAWFDETNSKVSWVYHEAIIEPEHLPTFSSHAIESAIHKVPGLGEHYLYFNDDIFLVKPLSKLDFFSPNGLAKIRLENYGMVHGELDEKDPDYLNAARNGQKLLKAHFGKVPTKLHTHSPSSAIRSVVDSCEQTFKEHYQNTRAKKFRTIEDISPTSFLYPHFAFLSGAGVIDSETSKIINSQGTYKKTLSSYSNLIGVAEDGSLPLCLCINDGGGSAYDKEWGKAVIQFMKTTYTDVSPAEKKIMNRKPFE